jgi:hypothetical protein
MDRKSPPGGGRDVGFCDVHSEGTPAYCRSSWCRPRPPVGGRTRPCAAEARPSPGPGRTGAASPRGCHLQTRALSPVAPTLHPSPHTDPETQALKREEPPSHRTPRRDLYILGGPPTHPSKSLSSMQPPKWRFYVWWFLRWGLTVQPRLALNLPSSCLNIPSAGIRHGPPLSAYTSS